MFDDELPGLSVVIATRNRCDPMTGIPLVWCLQALVDSVERRDAEIIVVDDASRVGVDRTLRALLPTRYAPLRVVRSERRLGSAVARNLALQAARFPLVLVLDDDCIALPASVRTARRMFSISIEAEPRVAAMQLPVYFRATGPVRVVAPRQIGALNPAAGTFTTNFDALPAVAGGARGNENGRRAWAPIPIRHLGGVFVGSRDALLSVGGFPEDLSWTNNFTEEPELGLRLLERGRQLMFLPDPMAGVVHLKWGHRASSASRADMPPDVVRMASTADSTTPDGHGNRVHVEGWCESKLLAYFVLFGRRSLGGGVEWMRRQLDEFVEENRPEFYGRHRGQVVRSAEQRQALWDSAWQRGARLLGADCARMTFARLHQNSSCLRSRDTPASP